MRKRAINVRKAEATFLATLAGLGAGVLTVSILGSVKTFVTLGPNNFLSFKGLLLSLPLFFIEDIIWSVIGAGMFVLPQALLLFTGYSIAFREDWTAPKQTRSFTLIFTAVLGLPIIYFGFRTRIADGILVVVSMLVGVRAGINIINRRLCLHRGE